MEAGSDRMATALEYKCPCCGGGLIFDSNTQNMQCPYCNAEIDPEALKTLDQALDQPTEDTMEWQDTAGNQWDDAEQAQLQRYVCNSCGGEIIGDANTVATSCPFCDNPVVLSGRVSGLLRPDLVIPFQLDKEHAMQAFAKHLSGKPLLPKVFKDEHRMESVQGIYVPFWIYDAMADAQAQYKATKVRFWSDSRYNYTETRHYRIYRSGKLFFASVPADGSTKMADDLMESIEPYDLNKAVDFHTAYLAGFLADKYDLTAQDCIPRVNGRIKNTMEQVLRNTVMGYSSVIPTGSAVRLTDTAMKYALYPVWVLTTRYRDKVYTFAMNGQTGRFVGNLPIDWKAFWLWLTGVTAGVGSLGTIISLIAGWL